MLANILVLLSLLSLIFILRNAVEIFPSLIACLIRWKESVNLENVTKYARYRDWTALAMILPFCITVHEFSLYDPEFMKGFNENIRLLTVIGIFLIYILLRFFLYAVMKSKKFSSKTYSVANRSSYNFFILLTLTIMLEGGLLRFFGADTILTQNLLLWSSAAVYLISLFRKLQILSSSCHFLSAFLYLCALEILPTGALVASAIIF